MADRHAAVALMARFVGVPYVYGGPTRMPDALSGTDCRGAVIASWEEVDPGCTGGATYTGDMLGYMLATGKWAEVAGPGQLSAGDVVLTAKRPGVVGHTAMCDGEGGLYDEYPPRGRHLGWYDYPWENYLHYIGDEEGEMTQEQVEQVAALAAQKVWEYAWYNAEGENTAPGGNMYNNIIEMRLLVEAQSTAMAKLAEVAGADPGEIAKAVSDAVAAKLEGISLSVEVAG